MTDLQKEKQIETLESKCSNLQKICKKRGLFNFEAANKFCELKISIRKLKT